MTTTARPHVASAAVSTAVPGPTSATAVDAVTASTAAPGPVDVQALRRVLDGRWADVRERARRDLREVIGRPVPGLDVEAYRDRVGRQMEALAANGTMRRGWIDPDGSGVDVGAGTTFAMLLGHGDLSLMVKAGVQWGLFGGALQALGTQRHHERYLRAVMDGALPGCFAMTETGHGSDVQSLRTTATYDADTQEFVVATPDAAARKDYIGGAARTARLAVVFAQLVTGGQGRGVHALLVPLRDESGRVLPGVTVEDCGVKGGLNGVDNGRLSFDAVRVPREALLDHYGSVAPDGTYSSPIEDPSRRFFTMIGTLVRGRVTIAGAAAAATENALTIAVRYGDVRRQFGRPGTADEVVLLDYRTHQRRLLPALALSYALRFAQDDLVAEMVDVLALPEPDVSRQRELESAAAGFKAVATWHATATVQACREACGGAGYMAENVLTPLRGDLDVFATFEGDNTVLMQLVAKGLLTSYRQAFGAMDTMGTVRMVADRVVGEVLERSSALSLLERLAAAAPGRDDEADLLDPHWHQRLFAWRERHVLDGLARRLKHAAGTGRPAFEAFNDAQDHAVRAARVHVHRQVLDAFTAAVERCPDRQVADLLGPVCALYALAEIEADRAWFLEHGRISSGRAKAVTAEVNALCRQLRPHARTLVDAFAVPQEWLGAPIARMAS